MRESGLYKSVFSKYPTGMEWLNYHHLLYFWVVAKQGSIARASIELHLAHPTISGQIHALEDALGEKLFQRVGRRLVLTEMGHVAFRYADSIFSLGRELMDTVKGRPTGRPLRLRVGTADVISKLVVRRLLEPARHLPEPVHIVCREHRAERLLAELEAHELDVVLADAPLGPGGPVRAYCHLLGECGISFLAAPKLALAHRRKFPRSLEGAPLLLPTDNTAVRRSIDQWFHAQGIRPRVVAEFEDSALLKVFGQDGLGIFPAPAVIEDAVRRQHRVQLVGRAPDIRKRYYAITLERRLKHVAVAAICEVARQELFR